MSFVILTDKDGIFRTEADASLRPVEAYDYFFYGQHKARFTLAEVLRETKVRVIETAAASPVNLVPSKLLEHFDTVEDARKELSSLTSFGSMDCKLRKVD
jgi:hypothetical protein